VHLAARFVKLIARFKQEKNPQESKLNKKLNVNDHAAM
jgi:hypothetical protein